MTGEPSRVPGSGRVPDGHARGRRASEKSRTHRRILGRATVGIAAAGVLVGASGCGFNPTQKDAPPPTVQTEVRGAGVNMNVGSGSQELFVRNLLVISRAHGSGFLSGSIHSDSSDSLQKVDGTVVTDSTKPNKPIRVKMSNSVSVGGGKLVKIENHTAIRLSSPDIHPGLAAKLRLTFKHAGSKQIDVPIVDGHNTMYRSVRPKSA